MEFDIGTLLRIGYGESGNRKIAAENKAENRVVEAHVILRMGTYELAAERSSCSRLSSNRTSSFASTVYPACVLILKPRPV